MCISSLTACASLMLIHSRIVVLNTFVPIVRAFSFKASNASLLNMLLAEYLVTNIPSICKSGLVFCRITSIVPCNWSRAFKEKKSACTGMMQVSEAVKALTDSIPKLGGQSKMQKSYRPCISCRASFNLYSAFLPLMIRSALPRSSEAVTISPPGVVCITALILRFPCSTSKILGPAPAPVGC